MYYYGEWENYEIKGNGQFYENGKLIYKGEFQNQSCYVGEKKNGKKHGKGIEYNVGGLTKYEGEFVDDLYEGKGTYILMYKNNHVYYKGEFKKGRFHGKGTLYYDDGKIKYEGDFFNGLYEGNGKLFDEYGRIEYIGEFDGNNDRGKGTYYYPDGKKKI